MILRLPFLIELITLIIREIRIVKKEEFRKQLLKYGFTPLNNSDYVYTQAEYNTHGIIGHVNICLNDTTFYFVIVQHNSGSNDTMNIGVYDYSIKKLKRLYKEIYNIRLKKNSEQ